MGLLRYAYPSNNRKCPRITIFCFWGLLMAKLHDFIYLVNWRSHKVGWPLKMTARMDLLWVFYNMHTPQITGKAPKMSFLELIRNFESFRITNAICRIKLAELSEWPTHHNIYIKNQRKWAEMRISGLLLNEILRISSETWFTITYMQINKNQRKINLCIMGANFRKNLNLAVSLHIIQF